MLQIYPIGKTLFQEFICQDPVNRFYSNCYFCPHMSFIERGHIAVFQIHQYICLRILLNMKRKLILSTINGTHYSIGRKYLI